MNLNAMSPEQLAQFASDARAHPRIIARELFDNKPGAVAAARDIAHYAINLAAELSLAAESEAAAKYRKICGRIKRDLPAYALSLLGDTPE